MILMIQTVISGNLEGVAYLNAIFTKRLGRHLNKEIRWRLLIITGIGAVILGIRYFSDNRQPLINDDKDLLAELICDGHGGLPALCGRDLYEILLLPFGSATAKVPLLSQARRDFSYFEGAF